MDFQALTALIEALRLDLPEPRTLLIVDDEPHNLDVLEAVLEDDWEVHTAADGVDALAVFKAVGKVDLVLTDQRMPRMTGVELLAEIAKRAPDTVRMVLTGYSDVEPIVAAVNDGDVERFFLKPWSPTEVRAAVRDALHERAMGAALVKVVGALDERRASLRATAVELERTQQQLIEAERMSVLGRLTSGITHDMGNVLQVMICLVEQVEIDTDDARVNQLAKHTLDSLQTLGDWLRNVNDLLRPPASRFSPLPTPAAPFLSETARLLQLEDVDGERSVDIRIEPGAEQLLVDVRRLRPAVLALLRNAAAASAPGQPVRLSAYVANGDRVCVEVRDEGAGMDAPALAAAMRPFYSGRNPPGTGLGLEIARSVVETHGGELTLMSEPGAGTRATLALPRRLVR